MEEQKEIWLDVEKTRQELLITYPDNEDLDSILTYPLRIGGTDLSFLQEHDVQIATVFGLPKAISCYVILEFTDDSIEVPKIIYKDFKQVELGKNEIRTYILKLIQSHYLHSSEIRGLCLMK